MFRRGQEIGPPHCPETPRAAWLGRALLSLLSGLFFWLLFAGVANAVDGSAVPEDPAGTVTDAVKELVPEPEVPDVPQTGVDEVDDVVDSADDTSDDVAETIWPDDSPPSGSLRSQAGHPTADGTGVRRADAAHSPSKVDVPLASAGPRADLTASSTVEAPAPAPVDAPEPVAVTPSAPGQPAVLCFAALPGFLIARARRRRCSAFTRARSANPAVSPD